MASFDPATVRQAVAEFTPQRPQKFQDLMPAKEVIAELRQRRASYRANGKGGVGKSFFAVNLFQLLKDTNYSETEEHKIKPHKLRNLRDHQCVLVHCERGFRRVTLAPLESDGTVANWFSTWRRWF